MTSRSNEDSELSSFLLHGSPSDRRTYKKRRKTTLIVESDDEEEEELPEGRLFGELHKSQDYLGGGDGVMSLSLLDWQRRQQWFPAANNNSKKSHQEDIFKLPARIVEAGIDAGLPSWETVNPIPRVPREPTSSLEPSRRRHNNATYASWCRKLINCLNGSGRMMAHHEFFYSDIDRAW